MPPTKLPSMTKEFPKANPPPPVIRCYCCGDREHLAPFHDVYICAGCNNDRHGGKFFCFMFVRILRVSLTQYLIHSRKFQSRKSHEVLWILEGES